MLLRVVGVFTQARLRQGGELGSTAVCSHLAPPCVSPRFFGLLVKSRPGFLTPQHELNLQPLAVSTHLARKSLIIIRTGFNGH